MAYSYALWAEQATTADQLTMLNRHIGEVTLTMGPSVSRDGASRSTAEIRQYLADLRAARKELMGMPDVGSDGGANVTRARFGS